jgi:hypothetical protein
MITSPTIDQILEGVIISLADDIMPSIENPKAAANCLMVQSLLQGVRQLLTVIDDQLVDEHNDMIAVLRRSAEALTDNACVNALNRSVIATPFRPQWTAPRHLLLTTNSPVQSKSRCAISMRC